ALATATASDVLTIGDGPNDYTSGGALTTTAVSGPGKVILPFANDYAGAWQINAGTLSIGSSASLGTDTSAIVVNGSGTLEIGNATFDRALTLNSGAKLIGTGTTAGSNGTATIPSGALVTIGTGTSASDVFTLGNAANDLTGGGGLSTITVSGAGKVVLTQASNYNGNWVVSSGSTLQMTAGGQVSFTVTVNNAGTLELASTVTPVGGDVNLNGGATLRGTGTAVYPGGGSTRITNALADVFISAPGAADSLRLGAAIRSISAAAS